jgi:hypothetical protein
VVNGLSVNLNATGKNHSSAFFVAEQSDQIGRIFAAWATVYFGHFLKIKKLAHISGATFSTVKVMH